MAVPTVSVALATYNGSEFLGRQLESILRQTLQPDQVVVADDGSTDESIDIVREAFSRVGSPRLVVLTGGPTRGVTRNFERAMHRCDGDLIALCDQDDVWSDRRIEKQVEVFRRYPDVTLLHSDAELVDESDAPLGGTLFGSLGVRRGEIDAIVEGRAFGVFLRRNLVTGATVMFRNQLLAASAPFPDGWLHDEWLGIIAAATGRVLVTEERLVGYRQHSRNQIGASDPTFRHRMSRVLQPRGDRHRLLVERSLVLRDRLEGLYGVSSDTLGLAEGKVRFEQRREGWPSSRLRRAPHVLTEFFRRDYGTYSSQRSLDAVRDFLQPR